MKKYNCSSRLLVPSLRGAPATWQSRSNPNKKSGFTLIELVIVLTLIGILSLVSFPTYNNNVIRVRRANIAALLMDIASRMEKYYLKNNTYTGANLTNLYIDHSSHNDYYELDITAKDDLYTLKAIPLGKQQNDPCGSLILDQRGNRGVSGKSTATQCWI